jgi:hypothetical protein
MAPSPRITPSMQRALLLLQQGRHVSVGAEDGGIDPRTARALVRRKLAVTIGFNTGEGRAHADSVDTGVIVELAWLSCDRCWRRRPPCEQETIPHPDGGGETLLVCKTECSIEQRKGAT